jgi:hypothetical protein
MRCRTPPVEQTGLRQHEGPSSVAELWLRHGPALREASDLWNAVAGVRECWYAIIYGLADRVANAISRDRDLGLAPPGPDAQATAQGLIWMGERILFLQISEAPRPLTIDTVVDVGTSIWMRTIYLSDDPDPVTRNAGRLSRERRKRRR